MGDNEVVGTDAGQAQTGTLSIRTYENDGTLVVEAVGAVTARVSEAFAQALRASAGCRDLPVTVDLRQVDYLDSVGLFLLVNASKRLRSPSVPLAPRVLVTPQGQPDRVLRLGTFGRILEIARIPAA